MVYRPVYQPVFRPRQRPAHHSQIVYRPVVLRPAQGQILVRVQGQVNGEEVSSIGSFDRVGRRILTTS